MCTRPPKGPVLFRGGDMLWPLVYPVCPGRQLAVGWGGWPSVGAAGHRCAPPNCALAIVNGQSGASLWQFAKLAGGPHKPHATNRSP